MCENGTLLKGQTYDSITCGNEDLHIRGRLKMEAGQTANEQKCCVLIQLHKLKIS